MAWCFRALWSINPSIESNAYPKIDMQRPSNESSSDAISAKGPFKKSPDYCCGGVHNQVHVRRRHVVSRGNQDVISFDAIRSTAARVQADAVWRLHSYYGVSYIA